MTSDVEIELYLIRHAESVINAEARLVGGRSNATPLSPRGIEQARELGRELKRSGIVPDAVYASPAVRTRETARFSLAEMGLGVEPLLADAIQEQSHGSYEGRLRTEVWAEDVLAERDRLGKDFLFDGGESLADVGRRMHGWATETFADMSAEDRPMRVFAYTHGGAIKFFASHLGDWSYARTFEIDTWNATVSLFVRRSGVWELAYLGWNAEDVATAEAVTTSSSTSGSSSRSGQTCL